MGGSAALIAATRAQPPVDAVISLSGEANPTSVFHIPLNAEAALPQLTAPAMFVVANLDQYTTVDETRAMYQAAKTGDKRLLVLPNQFDGFHGWMDLTQASGAFSATATKAADFITAHTRG
jgi:dienelactone hydrolase